MIPYSLVMDRLHPKKEAEPQTLRTRSDKQTPIIYKPKHQDRRFRLSRRKKLVNNSDIPQHAIETIARCVWPDILAYYESEEGQREFAAWQAAQAADSDKEDT